MQKHLGYNRIVNRLSWDIRGQCIAGIFEDNAVVSGYDRTK